MKRKLFFISALLVFSMTVALRSSAQDAPPPGVTQWPLRVDGPDGTLTVYEPQPEKFEGDTLTARAAVSLTPTAATDPEFGALWFQATVVTDRDSRLVTIQNIAVKRVKLPNSAADQETRFGQAVQQQIPPLNVVLSLDQLEATLGVVQKAKEESQQLQNTPPKIVFTTTPTTLVVLDGPPKLQATATPGVMSVVNTPFIMLLDMDSKTYYLKAGDTWMSAPDATGQWRPAGNMVPVAIADAGTKLTAPSGAAAQPQASTVTQILVAEEPTEVISSDGPPTYTPLPSNDLLYMSNTQSDVFMEVASQQYYVLLSGRWFMGPRLQGPWTFMASDKLPAGFAQIPADSPKAHVLVSIAGTQDAKDARLDAFIPQTSTVRRDSGANLSVAYDGDPQFVPVENTPITYANNCTDPVLFVENSYYCCHQAVWYHCHAATGPWEVATAVPQVIYTLPPSCPVYNCRYCYVYDSTPDVVYCGYLPGYTGCYVYGPTVVYGTGYSYPYWYHTQFIPHPYTWGFAPRYDYHAGMWGYGASVGYGPTWFAARPERHNWWGPQGYVDYRAVHNRNDRGGNVTINEHVTNVHNVTVNRINIYNRPENAQRNVVVNDAHRNVQINDRTNVARHDQPAGRMEQPAENNLYAGHDGQVYRRTNQGWEAHDSKGWSQMNAVPDAEIHPAEHAEKIPQHNERQRGEPQRAEPQRSDPQRNEPRHVQTHDEPAQAVPAHETPTHIDPPVHIDHPSREAPPSHVAPPVQHERPTGGLEEDHAARQRGGDRPSNSAGNDHPSAPVDHGNSGGGSANRGNSSGGSDGVNKGNGGNANKGR